MSKIVCILLMFLGIAISSCTTLKDAANGQGEGTSQVYNESYDEIWQELKNVISLEGLEVVSSDKDAGRILAQRGMKAFSYGENVAVFVDKINDGQTKVEVVSKKAIATNLTAKNWRKIIHKRMRESMK